MRARSLRRCGLAAAALLAAGCCLSAQQADARRDQLKLRNRARAEPAMRAAAEARGARLLPAEATLIPRPLDCAEGRDEAVPRAEGGNVDFCIARAQELGGCIRRTGDGHTFRILRAGAPPKLAIPVRPDGWRYAGIAERGDKLLLLLPRLSPRSVGAATQCECDGMPRPSCPEDHVFLIDDRPSVEIEEIWVPMIEDQLDWRCASTAV